MIIGFGVQELETAKKIMEECYKVIQENPENPQEALNRIEDKYRLLDEKYSEMSKNEVPERYSRFWCNYYEPFYKGYLVEFTFLHINRRHPIPNDGWACLKGKYILVVKEDEKHFFREF